MLPARAQNYDSLAAVYILKFKDIAVEEMVRAQIPASITLAQGLLETGFGQSVLMMNTNNHFGIKCHETWTGKTYRYHDDAPNECFRVYDDPNQSYRDHSDFLRNRARYSKLFTLELRDYKAWAYGLKEAGYATNPKYPDLLIKYIENYQLYRFDDPAYSDEAWLAGLNIDIQDEIFLDKNSGHQEKDDDVQIDASINYPKQSSIIKTGPKKIYKINKCKAVKVVSGEDLEVISLKTDVEMADLMAYNDLLEFQKVSQGQYVFLQPKKKKGADKTYKVKSTDNMWLISQNKGIQLPALLKRNFLVRGEEPEKGQTIYLKGKAPNKPKLRTIEEQTPLIVKSDVKSKDTTYPKLPQQTKISMDSSNSVIQWEDGNKLYENKPVKPYPMNDSVVLFDLEDMEKLANSQPNPKTQAPAIKHTVVKGDTMYSISKRYNVTAENIRLWNQMPDNNVKLGQVLLINP
jgi:LysM repeat protein